MISLQSMSKNLIDLH